MVLVIKSFLAGVLMGGVFALLKLPVPAPAQVAGLMGIVGIFAGYVLIVHLR